MGHSEANAAAAGLASLLLLPLVQNSVSTNAQLRRLNAHLSSLVSSREALFRMPVEVVGRCCNGASERSSPGRISSFGYSGTITHGLFELMTFAIVANSSCIIVSLFRS